MKQFFFETRPLLFFTNNNIDISIDTQIKDVKRDPWKHSGVDMHKMRRKLAHKRSWLIKYKRVLIHFNAIVSLRRDCAIKWPHDSVN